MFCHQQEPDHEILRMQCFFRHIYTIINCGTLITRETCDSLIDELSPQLANFHRKRVSRFLSINLGLPWLGDNQTPVLPPQQVYTTLNEALLIYYFRK